MRLRKEPVFWLFLGIALIALLGVLLEGKRSAEIFLEESGVVIQAEIADSQKEKYAGLSGRESICGNCGMLFILDREGVPEFSMRGMRFNLDFIWISRGKIVDLDSDIPIDFVGGIFPEGEADRALEVPAGSIERLGIRVGDKVKMK
ncbi:MAG: DUF192 domain-containing protein [Patescibacteria group bacterium]